jgi:uncharacterized Zn-finger protein
MEGAAMTDGRSNGATRHSPLDDNGYVQCVWCGTTFGTENDHRATDEGNLTHGPVVRAATGTELEAVIEVDPETELVHPNCWLHVETVRKAIEIGRRSNENASLEEFV